MNQRTQPYTGLARFVPGVALLKGFQVAMLRSELVAAVTVFAILVPSAIWSEQMEGMNVPSVNQPGQAPVTMLAGWLLDQAALHGVLQSTYNLGLTLLLVERTGSTIPTQGAPSDEHIR